MHLKTRKLQAQMLNFPDSQLPHSMAKDNFNKSKETTPTTSAAL